MLSASGWSKNQPNTVSFVLVDNSGVEITGLGSTFTLRLSKAGGSFVVGSGVKSEIGLGWYKYVSTAGESDTSGPVAIVITHGSILQQNLEYVVEDRVVTAIIFTYTLISTSGSVPIEGADILIYLDSSATQIAWSGTTDAFGVARDSNGVLPRLEPGEYFFFRYKPGFSFYNPDVETIS